MALTVRTITNIDDPLYDPSGNVLANVEVSALLVDSQGQATGAWDVFDDSPIAPVKKKATTNASGIIKTGVVDGLVLWPNDRGSEPTFYQFSIKGYPSMTFTAALPSGDMTPLKWIDFSGNTSPISSDTYGVPLRVVAGATLPVTGVLTADGGIVGYSLVWQITDSNNVTTEYPCTISNAATGTYSCSLSTLVVGNYIARLKYTTLAGQIAYTTKWIIEVTA